MSGNNETSEKLPFSFCSCLNLMDRHHIEQDKTCFIPSSLHESIKHNLTTGEGMGLMNEEAYSWLLSHRAITHSEYTQDVIRTLISHGATPTEIKELIVKAIGVVEQE